MCSILTPRARIPDTRIPQPMQPWLLAMSVFSLHSLQPPFPNCCLIGFLGIWKKLPASELPTCCQFLSKRHLCLSHHLKIQGCHEELEFWDVIQVGSHFFFLLSWNLVKGLLGSWNYKWMSEINIDMEVVCLSSIKMKIAGEISLCVCARQGDQGPLTHLQNTNGSKYDEQSSDSNIDKKENDDNKI